MKSGRRLLGILLGGAEVNITFRPTSLFRPLELVVTSDSRSRPGTVDPLILTITRLSSHCHGIRAGDCARVIKYRVRLNSLDSRDKGSNPSRKMTADLSRPGVSPCDP
ncbi:uncharacterized protein BO88DRAFT_427348 [Aspergillus vadensis CBS 113365]|uniref:Uncharacterized protein n=1 Tax=Aspergillus vadensis (strain CBS 113365 / IMI 142717 / IBT 24658) TaxID=1448311 RepID=A0A319B235_ASPVC|nr:hypothetical protein BO88DRAFT_427348 [Aspergillus vadensis CBS 113365]PYH66736.1 hypothetical protein BO88DRAFT_427348 [Aspergillus vadensis CBS 113365]